MVPIPDREEMEDLMGLFDSRTKKLDSGCTQMSDCAIKRTEANTEMLEKPLESIPSKCRTLQMLEEVAKFNKTRCSLDQLLVSVQCC